MSSSSGDRSGHGERLPTAALTEGIAPLAGDASVGRPEPTAARGRRKGEHEGIQRFCGRLEAGRGRRLREAWDREAKADDGLAAAQALERLRKCISRRSGLTWGECTRPG